MKVVEIWNTEYYRDGGSYGFNFDSDDGNEYEFYMQVEYSKDESAVIGYKTPVLYYQETTKLELVKEFSWDQAKEYVSSLKYDDERFYELVEIINNRGKRI